MGVGLRGRLSDKTVLTIVCSGPVYTVMGEEATEVGITPDMVVY